MKQRIPHADSLIIGETRRVERRVEARCLIPMAPVRGCGAVPLRESLDARDRKRVGGIEVYVVEKDGGVMQVQGVTDRDKVGSSSPMIRCKSASMRSFASSGRGPASSRSTITAGKNV